MKKHSILIVTVFTLFFTSVSYAQIITTFAGNGSIGYSGDNGPATAATFSYIKALCNDTAGNLYIPDYNTNVIRKVTPAGIITTIAGDGTTGYSGDGTAATAAKLDGPWGITTDKRGNVYFVEHGNNIVRKINAAGIISTFAGNTMLGYSGDGGPATSAKFLYPGHLAVDDIGNVYIADGNNVIRKVDTVGIVSTFAGTGTAGYNGDGGAATSAQLNNPINVLWKSGSLYISDGLNNRIRKVDGSGTISTVAGDGTAGNSGDGGPATAAQIKGQIGMAFDAAGNLYLSLFDDNVIRKITGTTISTIVGNGSLGFSGDGGNAMLAALAHPHGIVVDKTNQIFFVDQDNNRVRKVGSGITAAVYNAGGVVNKINIYPNPAGALLNIRSGRNIDHIDILNLYGQVVYTFEGPTSSLQIDISGLSAGIYLIKVNSVEVQKFIKQ